MAKKLLTKSDIFAKKGLDPRTVNVAEWGGEVLYKPMSMVERREVRKKGSKTVVNSDGESVIELDGEMMEVYTLMTCVLDPSDEKRQRLMFSPEDMDVLMSQMASGGISTVAQAILQNSGMAGNAIFQGKEETKS